jgi:hypothetical protein
MILKLFLLAGLLASASSQTAAEINAETIATLESGTKITKAPKASNAVSKASNKVDEREHPIQYTSTASGCQHSQHRHHHHHHHHTHHHHPPPLTLRPLPTNPNLQLRMEMLKWFCAESSGHDEERPCKTFNYLQDSWLKAGS